MGTLGRGMGTPGTGWGQQDMGWNIGKWDGDDRDGDGNLEVRGGDSGDTDGDNGIRDGDCGHTKVGWGRGTGMGTPGAKTALQGLWLGQVVLVEQDPLLFSGTIRENVVLGLDHCKESELQEAATAAGAMDFIQGLEQGWDTGESWGIPRESWGLGLHPGVGVVLGY